MIKLIVYRGVRWISISGIFTGRRSPSSGLGALDCGPPGDTALASPGCPLGAALGSNPGARPESPTVLSVCFSATGLSFIFFRMVGARVWHEGSGMFLPQGAVVAGYFPDGARGPLRYIYAGASWEAHTFLQYPDAAPDPARGT